MQNPKIQEKIKEIKIKRYGNSNYNNRDRARKTCLEKYGVEIPLQNAEIFKKAQKNSYRLNIFRNTNLTYQGSYELDFLKKFHDMMNIKNGYPIKYKFKGKNKIYYPDFYLPDFNMIIEVKNSYLYKRDLLQITEKEKSVISKGLKYSIIIDKNYENFTKTLFSRTSSYHFR